MYVCEVQTIREINCRTYNSFNGSLYPKWISTQKIITYTGSGLNTYDIDTSGYKYITIQSQHCLGYSSLYNQDLLYVQCNGTTVYSAENTNNHKTYTGTGDGAQYHLIVSCSVPSDNRYCYDTNHKIIITLSN